MPPAIDHHDFLREIRARLELTQEDMAARLGVRMSTYQAYEYHRGTISHRVLESARKLADDPTYSYIDEYIAGRSMREIASEWAWAMGVDAGDPQAMAIAIGSTATEVSAWLSGCRQYPHPDRFLALARRAAREAVAHELAVARRRKYASHGVSARARKHRNLPSRPME